MKNNQGHTNELERVFMKRLKKPASSAELVQVLVRYFCRFAKMATRFVDIYFAKISVATKLFHDSQSD